MKKSISYVATGPNDVWSWDISYLASTVVGQFFDQGGESQGSGLGLAIVAHIAKMNSGIAELANTHPTQFRLLLRNHP